LERRLRRQLGKLVPHLFPKQPNVKDQFRKLLKSDLTLSALCDIFAFALPLQVEFKQALLEELEVAERLDRLLKHLEDAPPLAPAEERKFPPEFSVN
jgi:ATP-dependent Lon protease